MSNRRALITGAGGGLGFAIAQGLARAGAHVVIADQAAQRIASVTAAVEDLGAHEDRQEPVAVEDIEVKEQSRRIHMFLGGADQS